MSPRAFVALATAAGLLATAPAPAGAKPPARQVSVRVNFVMLDWEALERWADPKAADAACREILLGGAKPGGIVLNEKDQRYLLGVVQGDRRSNIMAAPTLTARDGKAARFSATSTHYYVTGVDQVKGQGSDMLQPRNERIQTGIKLSVRPTVAEDGRQVRIYLRVEDKELDTPEVPLFPVMTMIKPIRADGKPGAAIPFTQFLQQPSFRTTTVEKRFAAADGQTVLVGGWATAEVYTHESGVPGAKDLPLVGSLFRVTRAVREVRYVYLLVTPHIEPANANGARSAKAKDARPHAPAAN